jgi:hypothetical protein
MIPLRRCGSHALRLRLNFNPHFYSPYPLHVIDLMPLLPSYGDLDDDRAYFRLITDVVGLQASSMVKWQGVVFDPVEIFEAIRHQKRSVHRIVWELLLRAGELHHARVVMDKSLDSVHYADELMELFPEMLFVNVVRDPRGQVASMNRAIIHDFDTLLNTHTWINAHRAARKLVDRHPDRVLTIRYEDFLLRQEETLRKVCSFLELEYLPNMLDVSRSHEASQISQLSALWASNCFPPIPANRDKFKQQLSHDEIELIETLTQDYMRFYGYPLMTDASAKLGASALDLARQRSEAAREAAWEELEQENFRDFVLRQHRAQHLAGVRRGLAEQVGANTSPAELVPYRLGDLKGGFFEVTD